jgi:hypothetical protein
LYGAEKEKETEFSTAETRFRLPLNPISNPRDLFSFGIKEKPSFQRRKLGFMRYLQMVALRYTGLQLLC